MAASSSKPTGVHYALVVFVLISIVCGLGWLLAYKGANSINELRASTDAANKKAAESQKQANLYFDDIRKLKEVLGHKHEDVGDGSNPNTVAGATMQEIKNYANGAAENTTSGVLVKQNELLRNTKEARDKLQEQLETEQAQFKQQVEALNSQLAAEKKAKDDASKSKIDADNSHSEEVKKKDEEIADLRKTKDAIQQKADEDAEAAQKKIKDLDSRIASLTNRNNQLTGELDKKTRVSFEKENGVIRWLDPVGRKVWVSLGEADGLKPRTTFSVYKKMNSGVGRGTEKGEIGGEDIKGAIEITRVLEAHLSEGRILSEDLYSPIAKGDPIYSPLWSSAHGEAFSIVGIMDLNGDGKDDRDLLEQAVATAGAVIDNDVSVDGILRIYKKEELKPRMNEKTKFLVLGKMPEVADVVDVEREALMKMHGFKKDLEDMARERGVRVLGMGDFLNYIGYKSQQRLFVPGDNAKYNLKSGAASAAVGETIGGSRVNSGNTSGAYSGDKSIKGKSVNNAVSKAFRK